MNICFVSRRFFPAISGMSVYAANFLRELVAAGHDVTMISQYRGDAFGRGVYGGGPPPSIAGVQIIGLEQIGEQDGGDFERDIDTIVRTVVEQHAIRPFDILHAQYGYPTGWAALLASRLTGVPNVVSIQGGDGHWVGSCCETHRRAMQAVLNHSGGVLIGARSFADEVTARLGTDPDRFTIIPGAVDTSKFRPAASPARRPPVMLYHGRIDRRKGIFDTLQAASLVWQGGDEFELVVSGIGPDGDEAARRVAASPWATCIRTTGYVDYDDAPDVYRGADIFVSPTYAEGFSNTILEAMASGLVCISCHAVGVVDCLRDGENGLLVEPGDVEALSLAMRRLLRDHLLRDQLSNAGLEECRRVYAWPKVAGRICKVYDRLAGTTPDRDFVTDLPREPCKFRLEPHLL